MSSSATVTAFFRLAAAAFSSSVLMSLDLRVDVYQLALGAGRGDIDQVLLLRLLPRLSRPLGRHVLEATEHVDARPLATLCLVHGRQSHGRSIVLKHALDLVAHALNVLAALHQDKH